MAIPATTTSVSRIPLNTLAIPLGLTGLAEVWSGAFAVLGAPAFLGQIFWVIAGVAFIWMLVAHILRGRRSDGRLSQQLVHPQQGPVAGIAPIIGMLFGGDLHRFLPVAGAVLALISMAAAAVFAAWILAFWMRGELKLESLHGGYFLPTVAAGFVAAGTSAQLGLLPLAIGAFGLGVFFWVVMFALLLARLALRPTLPDPLMPTLAILLAPPAVAGAAWFAIDGHRADPVEYALAAVAVMMFLLQLALVPRYLKVAFTLGFSSFTFPLAYAGAYAIEWLGLLRPVGFVALVVLLVAGVTAVVLGIAIKSIAQRLRTSAPPLTVVA